MLLVLPGIAQRGEAGLQRNDSVLQIGIEPFQLIGEAPHLFRIHYGLWHNLLSKYGLNENHWQGESGLFVAAYAGKAAGRVLLWLLQPRWQPS